MTNKRHLALAAAVSLLLAAAGARAAAPALDLPIEILFARQRPEGRARAQLQDRDRQRQDILRHRLPGRAARADRLCPFVRASDVPGLGKRAQGSTDRRRHRGRRLRQRLDPVRLHRLCRIGAFERAGTHVVAGRRPHGAPGHQRACSRTSRASSATRSRSTSSTQPYGAWPWIDLPMLANSNWYNAHNFYGDLKEIEAATVADAKEFSSRYYRPNNAVLVIQGEFEPAQARAMVERYFGDIPRGTQGRHARPFRAAADRRRASGRASTRWRPSPATARLSRPRARQRRLVCDGPDRPDVAAGRRQPLYRALSGRPRRSPANSPAGSTAILATCTAINGPALWMASFTHDSSVADGEIAAVVDEVIDDFAGAARPAPRNWPAPRPRPSRPHTARSPTIGAPGSPTWSGWRRLFGDDPADGQSHPRRVRRCDAPRRSARPREPICGPSNDRLSPSSRASLRGRCTMSR